ncbi:MAG TPA: DinB family protein [Ignavibacteriaceae bacterium]
MKNFVSMLFLCSFLVLPLSANVKFSGDEPVFVKEFIGQMDFVKGRLMQLAEAMPDEKYNWTPAEGVRTVGEVYVHAAEANFYLVTVMMGTKPDMNQKKSDTDKKTALAMIEKSIDAVKEAAAKLTEDDLNREVEAFGMKFSLRNFMITMLNHNHEHLGQSIAYARMNGVVPPWSMKE